jgi:hypothetical protein
MSAPQVSTIIKTVTRRAWSDIEPKVLAFLATGLSAGLVTEAANYVGVDINPGLAVVIATCVASIAGYLKKSTAKTEIPAPAPVAAAPAPVVQAPAA